MTQQSIAACLVLSALGGVMGVLATAALAHPAARKRRRGRNDDDPPPARCCGGLGPIALSVLCQVGIAAFSVAATWYGPVSVVVPTAASAQLLFNMVVFGAVLGLESFSKEMRVGAYVVVLAAILLPVVGPGVQEGQDVRRLLAKKGAVVWSGFLLATMGISAAGLAVTSIRRKRDDGGGRSASMFAFNVVVQTSSAAVGTTAAKMFVLVDGKPLVVCMTLWLLSSLILVYATILQATTVSQATFVPISVGAKIAVNAVTGIVVWEDWRVVSSWTGYMCVFLYLMLGNYLLCDVDLFRAREALNYDVLDLEAPTLVCEQTMPSRRRSA